MLTHKTLNLYSLIGTILLVGIVAKNGILLVMTSISVIAGNIPLALAIEPGSSLRSSLGIVVIGSTSSLLLTFRSCTCPRAFQGLAYGRAA